MKKIFGTILSLAVAMFAFTSCEFDEDTHMSTNLAGEWTGNWGVYYNYNYYGKTYTFDSYYSDVVFYPEYEYARRGYGKEVDFYSEGPYTKIYNYFYWEVRNGVIHLTYPEMPEYNTSIYDYRMTSYSFTGYFDTSEFGEPFTLKKIADYYDWNYYSGYNTYYNRNNWYYDYYAKTRSAVEGPIAIDSDEPAEGKIIGGGRHKINVEK